ncbi:MAG: hypothetical protein ACFFDT_16260 [Candidatus Hodarchaeota archaeon]
MSEEMDLVEAIVNNDLRIKGFISQVEKQFEGKTLDLIISTLLAQSADPETVPQGFYAINC